MFQFSATRGLHTLIFNRYYGNAATSEVGVVLSRRVSSITGSCLTSYFPRDSVDSVEEAIHKQGVTALLLYQGDINDTVKLSIFEQYVYHNAIQYNTNWYLYRVALQAPDAQFIHYQVTYEEEPSLARFVRSVGKDLPKWVLFKDGMSAGREKLMTLYHKWQGKSENYITVTLSLHNHTRLYARDKYTLKSGKGSPRHTILNFKYSPKPKFERNLRISTTTLNYYSISILLQTLPN